MNTSHQSTTPEEMHTTFHGQGSGSSAVLVVIDTGPTYTVRTRRCGLLLNNDDAGAGWSSSLLHPCKRGMITDECWTSGYVTWRVQLGKQQGDVEAETAPAQLREALKCLASFAALSAVRERRRAWTRISIVVVAHI